MIWVIRQFLLKTSLQEDAWYGFLSHKFKSKTSFSAEHVMNILQNHTDDAEVIIFSSNWDQVAYFRNPFEQGEFWHPGLLNITQQLLDTIGINFNVKTLLTDSISTVFSTYIIAKPIFWRQWLEVANTLFNISENKNTGLSDMINHYTSYGSISTPT